MLILPRFDYVRPTSIKEAISYNLRSKNALYLAGGTDLIPRMKLGLNKPELIIDLKGIEDIEGIKADNDTISIGALTTLWELERSKLLQEYFPHLVNAINLTSCETLKTRATIGGNIIQELRCLFYNQSEFWRKAKGLCFKTGGYRCHITGKQNCHANYRSDLGPVLLSLHAKLVLEGPAGRREMLITDLYTGEAAHPYNLFEGEIITHIVLSRKKTKGGYWKLRVRGAIDYPEACVAISVIDGSINIAVGALGPSPYLLTLSTSDLRYLDEFFEKIQPVANTFLEPRYRWEMAKYMAKKLVLQFSKGGKNEHDRGEV